jgi:salicylate biosynthesis isochorismate synthase
MTVKTSTLPVEVWVAREIEQGLKVSRQTRSTVWWHAEHELPAGPTELWRMGWRGLKWGMVTPDDTFVLGLGEAARVEAQAFGWTRLAGGFRQLKEATGLPSDWVVGGGFAFGRGRWPGFPAAYLGLPGLTVHYRPGQDIRVRLAVRLDPVLDAPRLIRMYVAWWKAFSDPPPDWVTPAVVPGTAKPTPPEFGRLVARAEAHCRAGDLQKVVVARSIALDLTPAPEPEAIWRRVVRHNPETYRFFVRRGTRVFMGASPETLAKVDGTHVSTMCLAGTTTRSISEDLVASDKDRREHEWVRRHVAARLARVATEVSMPAAPAVRWVGEIGHLWTPVDGTLKPGLTIWDAAEALHPTPAVGGTPTRTALDFIAREESTVRGWYAGGVGWANLSGEGWLAVGLRSMLYDTARGRATLYAGVGVVAGSDPARELAETEWKLKPMRDALEGSLR